jgi:hypothetical protein
VAFLSWWSGEKGGGCNIPSELPSYLAMFVHHLCIMHVIHVTFWFFSKLHLVFFCHLSFYVLAFSLSLVPLSLATSLVMLQEKPKPNPSPLELFFKLGQAKNSKP